MTAQPPDSSWHLQETYKGMVTIAVETLKILALINGGAAVAVLTYLGNLVARAPFEARPDMIPTLWWYCIGLFAVALAFVFAYMTQNALYNEERRRTVGHAVSQYHGVGVWVGILLVLFSAVAFGVGCYVGARTLAGTMADLSQVAR